MGRRENFCLHLGECVIGVVSTLWERFVFEGVQIRWVIASVCCVEQIQPMGASLISLFFAINRRTKLGT